MWMFLEPYPTVEPPETEPEESRAQAGQGGQDGEDAATAVAAELADRESRAAAVAGAALAAVVGSPAAHDTVEANGADDFALAELQAEETAVDTRRPRGGAYLPANGRPARIVCNAAASAPAIVRLYVHPGRVLIGEMTAERVAGQLDMDRAVLFESMGAAELAADEGAGFLIEVCEPFRDADGARRESGCYFLGRLC